MKTYHTKRKGNKFQIRTVCNFFVTLVKEQLEVNFS